MPTHLARFALHMLLVITMITASIVVPAQAATDSLRAAAATRMAATMADMPCGDKASSKAHHMPCDCCNPVSCDLSACIGTACLPDLPRMVSSVPSARHSVPWELPARPSRIVETPLRPPIA